jgi:hypothetical protein
MQVDDANNAVVIGGAITWRTPSATGRGFIQLPPGTWQIVCMSKEATEEQARAIVEEFSLRGSIRYTDYTRKYMWHGTAIESLKSLLTSKGRDTKQNYLILKKTA